MPFWLIGMVIASIFGIIGLIILTRYLNLRGKRFKVSVDYSKLPKAGKDAIFIGKVAETGMRAFFDLNKLKMHALVAGATGSGKTVAAQDIIEAALLKKKSVIVFDPTAQWTGFFRKCVDRNMLRRYKFFDMKTKESKPFNGSIRTITDPYEVIDIKKYMDRPGEITVFNVSGLSPKEIDLLVASTVEQIFDSRPEESTELKTIFVYDEVHRLLPKFGGSGEGFVQLERGCREFRKWGLGLVLISQVLSDFVGEIKANIGTEVQMGTRYEGDLERVGMKYGEDVHKSVVKEPIGTGMVMNAEYNAGRPYFVAFRPIMHSPRRLSNQELEKYSKYFDEIEDIDFQIEKLKEFKIDVMDLELELRLAKTKIKQGQFQVADMYMETLRPKILEQWKASRHKPIHLVRKRISHEAIAKGVEKAKSERKEIIEKEKKELTPKQAIIELKKRVEEAKKKGKQTAALEIDLTRLVEEVKKSKGKDDKNDELKKQIDDINSRVDKL